MSMTYSISSICSILHLPEPIDPAYDISELLIDSRSLTYPRSSLFFALKTSNNDGHKYLLDLYERGVRNFVVTHIPDGLPYEMIQHSNMLVVPDTLKALHAVARYHRNRFDIPVIGITGSRGKTTVKEWLYQLLAADYDIVRSPRSYNSQIGVPLSVWGLNDATQLGIFEAGISQCNEMHTLQALIRPTLGIITNIGNEHSDGFASVKAKCDEKVMLLRDCDCIIYNGDDRLISNAVAEASLPVKEIAWSMYDSDRPLYISRIEKHKDATDIYYSYLRNDGHVTIPFVSEADIQNAIHCLAVQLYLNRPADLMAARMSMLTPVGTRLEVIEGVNNCMVIYDSYTSDFNSLAPALDFMSRRRTNSRSMTVILSDVMHETLEPAKLYQEVANLLNRKGVARVIGIGEEISRYSRYFNADSMFYPTTSAFLDAVSSGDFDYELILIKGASHFHFELINDMLEAKQHETVLEVNLGAIVDNFNLFRSKVAPTTGIICMVKASGYGAGSYELAKTLQSQGAAYLAVAVLDEGVDLRNAGITMPIMVMNPRGANYKTLFSYNLEPEVYSFEMLKEMISEGMKYGIVDYPIHIKLDTGMHRLGFVEEEIPELLDILKHQKIVRPCSVFSHLAAADCLDMDDYTQLQFDYFDRCYNMISKGFTYHIMRHILNSTGIVRFPEYQYDLVRLGIGLYGVATLFDGSQDGLRQVSSLRTVIISIREWPEGTTIGYSRRGVLKRQSRIATIPIGYADGINRHFGNGGMKVYVNGHRCPTVGNICMDACMIDVTGVDCKVGSSVEIFGENVPVSELSDTLNTIPYEILTSVSQRVKRIYYRE